MKIFSLAIVASILSSAFARSSVYLISEHQRESNATPNEISLDTFELVYSHLLDTASKQQQPSLKLQQNAQSEFDHVNFLWSNPSNDLFQRKLNGNLMVIIDGVDSPQDLFDKEASFYITEDDGDLFADISKQSIDHIKENKDQGIVSIYDAKAELLSTEGGSVVLPMDSDFITRYSIDVLDSSKETDREFMDQIDIAEQMILLLKKAQGSRSKIDLELINLNGLQLISDEYGAQSKQYKEAIRVLKHFFNNIAIPTVFESYSSENPALSTFVFTPIKHRMSKRALPVIQDTSCFASKEDCNNNTSSCNGHGTCKKVADSCYSCQCNTQSVGDACQYIDAVGDFQLLFWTGVFFIVTTAGVLTFVYKSGNIDNGGVMMSAQPLPKQE